MIERVRTLTQAEWDEGYALLRAVRLAREFEDDDVLSKALAAWQEWTVEHGFSLLHAVRPVARFRIGVDLATDTDRSVYLWKQTAAAAWSCVPPGDDI